MIHVLDSYNALMTLCGKPKVKLTALVITSKYDGQILQVTCSECRTKLLLDLKKDA
jgi:hypothetical protein